MLQVIRISSHSYIVFDYVSIAQYMCFRVDGYLCCVWFGAIMNNAIMNILAHVFWWTYVSKAAIANFRQNTCVPTFIDLAKRFIPKVLSTNFKFLMSSIWNSWLLYILAYTWYLPAQVCRGNTDVLMMEQLLLHNELVT